MHFSTDCVFDGIRKLCKLDKTNAKIGMEYLKSNQKIK